MSELNKIFDVKSREARRKILDNYPISANDKNEILNKIGNSGGEGGKSRYFKVYDGINTTSYDAAGLHYLQYYNCFTLKLINRQGNVVITQGYNSLHIVDYASIVGFSFTPGIVSIFDNHGDIDERQTIACKYCSTIEELVELAKLGGGEGSSWLDPTCYIEKEITEEEYSKVDVSAFFINDNDSGQNLYFVKKNGTCEDFVNSEYSKQKYIIKNNKVFNIKDNMYVISNNTSNAVKSTDIITFDYYFTGDI